MLTVEGSHLPGDCPVWVERGDFSTIELPKSVAPEPSPGREAEARRPGRQSQGVQTEPIQLSREEGAAQGPDLRVLDLSKAVSTTSHRRAVVEGMCRALEIGETIGADAILRWPKVVRQRLVAELLSSGRPLGIIAMVRWQNALLPRIGRPTPPRRPLALPSRPRGRRHRLEEAQRRGYVEVIDGEIEKMARQASVSRGAVGKAISRVAKRLGLQPLNRSQMHNAVRQYKRWKSEVEPR